MLKKRLETICFTEMVLIATLSVSASEPVRSDNVEIRLWQQVTVTKPEIHLAEMADIIGTSDDLAALRRFLISNALIENQPLIVRAWDISRRLAEAGFDSGAIRITGAARCEINYVANKDEKNDKVKKSDDALSIAGAARLAGPSTLETKVRELICNRLSEKQLSNEAKITITFNPTLQELLSLTEPPYRFVIEPQQSNVQWMGLVGLNVKIYRDNNLVRNIAMLVDVQVKIPVIIANTTINSKSPITRNDIKTVWKDISQNNTKSFTDLEKIIDSQAKRMIPAGAIITSDMIESIPLVRRNQLVTVVYQKGGLEIKLVGKSLNNAGRNEIVRVRNERSKEIFSAKVIDSGKVLVESNTTDTTLASTGTSGGNF